MKISLMFEGGTSYTQTTKRSSHNELFPSLNIWILILSGFEVILGASLITQSTHLPHLLIACYTLGVRKLGFDP